MFAYEKVKIKEQPDFIVVVGDLNSTMACTIEASKIAYSWTINSPLHKFYSNHKKMRY